MPAKDLPAFQAYVQRHTPAPSEPTCASGTDHRFVDPQFTHSAPVRLHHRTQQDVARYLLNYMGRDQRYTEKVRNCQAFAADFFGFAAGKKGVEPFAPFLRPLYKQRAHLFLYDPSMYDNPEVDGEQV